MIYNLILKLTEHFHSHFPSDRCCRWNGLCSALEVGAFQGANHRGDEQSVDDVAVGNTLTDVIDQLALVPPADHRSGASCRQIIELTRNAIASSEWNFLDRLR